MPKQVLTIDDSLPLHKLVKVYLAPECLSMHSAYDGASGLDSATRLRPSLIILDVDMPRMDGFEVCRRLKSNPETARIPVIFLTANSTLDNRVRGLDIGASDYITKPFKPDELRARVRASLRARNQMESANLIDGATGLWNRAYLDEHLDVQVSLAKRFGAPLSCVMVDVNYGGEGAARTNSTTPADPGILRTIAQVFSGRCRAEDVVCRLDTWKFAILATRADRDSAVVMAERIRSEVERQLRFRNGCKTPIACNVGVADALTADAATLLDRARAAICQSQYAGFDNSTLGRVAQEVVSAVA